MSARTIAQAEPTIVPPPVPVPPAWQMSPPPFSFAEPVAVQSSLAERYRPDRLRRQWFVQWWRDIPCWLTSLVAHLGLVVLLGMMILPARNAWNNPFTLLVSLAAAEDELNATEVHIVATPRAEPTPATDEGPPRHLPQPQRRSGSSAIEPSERPTPWPRATAITAGTASLVASIRETLAETNAHAEDMATAGRPAGVKFAHQEHQKIVDDFIQYDIGRLRGAAGRRAAKRFHALGPEALPALVQGLNRAASISASCPVGVITHKVLETTAMSEDPGAMQYVLDNLGRDVPPAAPHSARLQNLAENFRQLLDARRAQARQAAEQTRWRRGQIRDQLARHGYHQIDDASIDQIEILCSAWDLQGTLAMAGSGNAIERRNALCAMLLRQSELRSDTAHNQVVCARQAIEALVDKDREVRRVALDVVERFLQLSELGITVDSPAQQRAECRDRLLVDFERRIVARRHAAEADAQLMLAEQLARAGRADKAADRFRQIVADFPGTRAAQIASRRLDQRQLDFE